MGLGIGLFNPANNSAIMGSLPGEDKSGFQLLALSRNMGMVIGVAFAEMVVALTATSETKKDGLLMDGIQYVWKLISSSGLLQSSSHGSGNEGLSEWEMGAD